MARTRIHGFAHAGILATAAIVAISGLLLWVYYNSKSAQLAQTTSASATQPITTTAQAVTGVKQVQASLNSLNVNAQLDTSTIDAVLSNQ